MKCTLEIKYSKEEKIFIARIPEIDGLSAHGVTRSEAAKEIFIALEGFLEVMKEDEEVMPFCLESAESGTIDVKK